MDDAVARIKDKIDIVDYIGRSVTLKKAGRNFVGLCPFHSEHSPSFNVSPERGVFRCFGCGVSGDVFNYLMQHDGLSFPEALKILAAESGVELTDYAPKQNKAQKSLEERYLEMHELAADYYHYLLTTHEVGLEAREYLERRGFRIDSNESKNPESIIPKFKLGYAPKSWDGLSSFLIKKGYALEEMIGCGLAVRSEKSGRGGYDMFRGRVMFPLSDKSGRVVGFAGRVLGTDKTAKYINTAETPIFHKREFLYGYYHAKDFIRRKGEAVLVEGEMDMLSSFQAGVKNVVAVKGSALTLEQVELLGRVCNRLLLCFDADFAGDKAMRKAITLAQEKDMEIKVIQLKSGKDPDECIKKGVDLWLDSIAHAVPYYDFLIQSGMKRHSIAEAFGKKEFLEELLPHINSIKNTILQSHYLQKLSTLVDMPEARLSTLMHTVSSVHVPSKSVASGALGVSRKTTAEAIAAIVQARPAVKDESTLHQEQVHRMERHFLAILLRMQNPVPGLEKKLQLADIDDKTVRLVYNLYIDFFEAHPDSYIADFIHSVHGNEASSAIDELFLIDVPFESEERLSKELFFTVKQLKELVLRERIKLISNAIKKAELSGASAETLGELQKESFSLQQRLGRVQRTE